MVTAPPSTATVTGPSTLTRSVTRNPHISASPRQPPGDRYRAGIVTTAQLSRHRGHPSTACGSRTAASCARDTGTANVGVVVLDALEGVPRDRRRSLRHLDPDPTRAVPAPPRPAEARPHRLAA